MEYGSRDVAKAAIRLAMTSDRESEDKLKQSFNDAGMKCAAVDFGGEFMSSMAKVLERAAVCAKREGLISDSHLEEGAVVGAAHEALSQIMNKVIGMNVGGKIGIARAGEHIAVAVFFGVGLLHLNDVCIGLGHRAL